MFGVIAVSKVPEINGKTAYADGHVYLQEDQVGSIYFGRMDESFFAPTDKYFKYNETAKDWLIPGGSKSGTLTVQNQSTIDLKMGLTASSTGEKRGVFTDDVAQEYIDFFDENSDSFYTPNQLQYLSKKLVDEKLLLKIYRTDQKNDEGKSKVVYAGMLNGTGISYALSSQSKDFDDFEYADPANDDDWDFYIAPYLYTENMEINMGTLKPNETATFAFTLKAPVDLKSYLEGAELDGLPSSTRAAEKPNQGYSGAVAMIDWVFSVEYASERTPETPTDPTSTPSQPTTAPTTKAPDKHVPKTGEAAVPYTAAAVACGVSALVIYFVTFGNVGKKKKEES